MRRPYEILCSSVLSLPVERHSYPEATKVVQNKYHKLAAMKALTTHAKLFDPLVLTDSRIAKGRVRQRLVSASLCIRRKFSLPSVVASPSPSTENGFS